MFFEKVRAMTRSCLSSHFFKSFHAERFDAAGNVSRSRQASMLCLTFAALFLSSLLAVTSTPAKAQEAIILVPDGQLTVDGADLSVTVEGPQSSNGGIELDLGPPITVPPPPTPGSLTCAAKIDGSSSQGCPNIAATKIQKLKSHAPGDCPSGSWHDLIQGGSCWSCPSGYIRSTLTVEGEEACWKASSLVYEAANLIGKTCRAGEFWDPRNGGECWSCPSGYNRTWDAVTWKTACSKSIVGPFSKATYQRKGNCEGGFYDIGKGECWSCPSGYSRTLNPVDDDKACVRSTGTLYSEATMNENLGCGWIWRPGLPKAHVNNSDASCYACPTIDGASGEILITEPASSSRTQCSVGLRWKPYQGQPWGLGDMEGALFLAGEILSEPELLTNYMHYRGQKAGAGDLRQHAEKAWQELQGDPLRNDYISSLLGIRLLKALQTSDRKRTAAERKLAKSFQRYVDQSRLNIAQDNLDMYDAWKAQLDLQKQLTRRSDLVKIFDYGTVPPNFIAAGRSKLAPAEASFAATAALPVATGFLLSTAGTIPYLSNTYHWWIAGASVDEVSNLKYMNFSAKTLRYITKLDRALKVMTQGKFLQQGSTAFQNAVTTIKNLKTMQGVSKAATGASAAAVVVGVVGSILLDIAIDQAIAIESARPKLVALRDEAKKPVNLAAMAAENPEKVMFWWSLLLDKEVRGDENLVTLAKASADLAKAADYFPARAWKPWRLSTEIKDLAVGADGTVWILTPKNTIYSAARIGGRFLAKPGNAKSISAGLGNDAWVVNTVGMIYRWANNKWTLVCNNPIQCQGLFPASGIDVSADGKHVIASNSKGQIFYTGNQGRTWAKFGDSKSAGFIRFAVGSPPPNRQLLLAAIQGTQVNLVFGRGRSRLPLLPGATNAQGLLNPASIIPLDVSIDRQNTIWVTAASGHVFAMTNPLRSNATKSWSLISTVRPPSALYSRVSAGDFPIFASTHAQKREIGFLQQAW